MLGGPAVGIEATAAESDQRSTFGKTGLDQHLVERIEVPQRGRTSKGVSDFDVDVMKSRREKLRRGAAVREGIGELHAPRPRIARQRLLGLDNPRLAAVHGEAVAGVAMPLVHDFTGKDHGARPRVVRSFSTGYQDEGKGAQG